MLVKNRLFFIFKLNLVYLTNGQPTFFFTNVYTNGGTYNINAWLNNTLDIQTSKISIYWGEIFSFKHVKAYLSS